MTTPDCDTSMMLDDEPLLRGDLVFAIARAASQDSVLALRATGKSLSHQVEPKWAFTHLAPRSKLTQELIKRYASCHHSEQKQDRTCSYAALRAAASQAQDL